MYARLSKRRQDRGFTIIELIVVLVMIGVIVAAASWLHRHYQRHPARQGEVRYLPPGVEIPPFSELVV